MPKKLKPIPEFRSEDEEREFWATHDATHYFDWSRAWRAVLPDLEPSTETISLRLPGSLLADLKVLANRVDVPYQSLLKLYLADRVRQEFRRDRTPEELATTLREPEAPYGAAPPGTHRPKTSRRAKPTRRRS